MGDRRTWCRWFRRMIRYRRCQGSSKSIGRTRSRHIFHPQWNSRRLRHICRIPGQIISRLAKEWSFTPEAYPFHREPQRLLMDHLHRRRFRSLRAGDDFKIIHCTTANQWQSCGQQNNQMSIQAGSKPLGAVFPSPRAPAEAKSPKNPTSKNGSTPRHWSLLPGSPRKLKNRQSILSRNWRPPKNPTNPPRKSSQNQESKSKEPNKTEKKRKLTIPPRRRSSSQSQSAEIVANYRITTSKLTLLA